jgi:hypothetical protein
MKPVAIKMSYLLIMFSYFLYQGSFYVVPERKSFVSSVNIPAREQMSSSEIMFADLEPNPTSENIPIEAGPIANGERRSLPEDVHLPFSRIIVYLLLTSAIFLISSLKRKYLRRARSHKITAKNQLRPLEALKKEMDEERVQFRKDNLSKKCTAVTKEHHGHSLKATLLREIYEISAASDLEVGPIEITEEEQQLPYF